MSAPKPVRAVVLGYGRAGKGFHAYLISQTPGMIVHGVVSSRPEARAAAEADHACQTYETLEQALEDPLAELIVIVTPNSTHADLAVQALDAGKHVVTDKVFCLDLAEFHRMEAAAQRSGKVLTCFQNRRHDGDYRTVQHLIEAGRLGDVRWIEAAWQGPTPMRNWRAQAEFGGGRFYDLGPHLLDQILQLFPAPVESVYCRMHHDEADLDTETEALMVLEFADARTAILDVSSRAYLSKPRFYVRGDLGTFEKYGLDPQENAMMNGNIDSAKESAEFYGKLKTANGEETITTRPGRWRNYYENIAAALRDQAKVEVTLPQLQRQIAVLEAGRRSARERCVVRLNQS